MSSMRALFSNCTIVSIGATDDAPSDTTALVMAKRFGSACRTILVTNEDLQVSAQATFGQILDTMTGTWRGQGSIDPLERSARSSSQRVERYLAMARSLGIEPDITLRASQQALDDVRAAPQEGLLILVQPADPLARQSHPFAGLRHAGLLARAPIVFAPSWRLAESNGILVLAAADDDPAIGLADQMGQSVGEPVERSGASRLDALDPAWVSRRARPPTLIVKTRDAEVDDPASVSRNILRLRVPVLLIEPEFASR